MHLGAYAADSVKTVCIYSNSPWIKLLERPRPKGLVNPNMVNHYTDKDGRPKFSGGAALKGSQCHALPKERSACLADVFAACQLTARCVRAHALCQALSKGLRRGGG